MRDGRKQRLQNIGFIFDAYEHVWDQWFSKLEEYHAAHGHCNVPYRGWKEAPNLGMWVGTLRQDYRKKKLSKKRIERLKHIGFQYDMPKRDWEQKFQELKQYKKEHGHCNVPCLWKGNPSLGSWVSHQRKLYKKKKLMKETIQRFDEIGFRWSLHRGRCQGKQAFSSDEDEAPDECNDGLDEDIKPQSDDELSLSDDELSLSDEELILSDELLYQSPEELSQRYEAKKAAASRDRKARAEQRSANNGKVMTTGKAHTETACIQQIQSTKALHKDELNTAQTEVEGSEHTRSEQPLGIFQCVEKSDSIDNISQSSNNDSEALDYEAKIDYLKLTLYQRDRKIEKLQGEMQIVHEGLLDYQVSSEQGLAATEAQYKAKHDHLTLALEQRDQQIKALQEEMQTLREARTMRSPETNLSL